MVTIFNDLLDINMRGYSLIIGFVIFVVILLLCLSFILGYIVDNYIPDRSG